MTGAEGLGSAASAFFAQPSSPVGMLQSLSGGEGGSSVSPPSMLADSSASISGLGQLFSNLQQLQGQNPGQFAQALSQIGTSLQASAQQQTGGVSQFLSNLANTFLQAASSGTAPQLNNSPFSQTYNNAGQAIASQSVDASTSASLDSIFANLATQIGTAAGS
jgi:hypothetical protein